MCDICKTKAWSLLEALRQNLPGLRVEKPGCAGSCPWHTLAATPPGLYSPRGSSQESTSVAVPRHCRPSPPARSPLPIIAAYTYAGPGNDPVQVYRTGLLLHWVKFTSETGFELPSSWINNLPGYGLNLNRNILDFMRWPQIGLGAQDLNDIQRPKSFQHNSWK
jgi:hypothetical protein